MQCPRGSSCTETNHDIKTLKAAQEWFSEVTEDQLPITVNQVRAANGRLRVMVYSAGKLINERG